jgi:hypothetical protein
LNGAVDIFAGYQVREAQVLQNAAKAEIEKLGAAAPARVDAIVTWLKSMGGRDFEPLVNVIRYAPHSGTIRGLETLMQKWSSQGGAAYSNANRDIGSPKSRPGDIRFLELWPEKGLRGAHDRTSRTAPLTGPQGEQHMSEQIEGVRRAVARRAEIAASSNLPDEATIAPAPNPGPFRQGHHDGVRDDQRHLAALRRHAASIGLQTVGTTKTPVRINSALNYPPRRA